MTGLQPLSAVAALDGGMWRPAPPGDPDAIGLAGSAAERRDRGVTVERADRAGQAAYRAIRREVFCAEYGLFHGSDADDADRDPATVVLIARHGDGEVVGGVRVAPVPGSGRAWWIGSRLAVTPTRRGAGQIGARLVRAACAYVTGAGALRFDATVRAPVAPFFARLGWVTVGATPVAGHPHVEMRFPIDRLQRLVERTKAPLGPLLAGWNPGGPGFVGDDGAPVPGSDQVAAMDAIIPSMVERDPEWAGWCSVLVNVNDLTAMGATPVGLLDAVAAPTPALASAVLAGIARAAAAWGVEVLGGHTQLGVPPSLAVTALGRTTRPVPAGGGRPGHTVHLTADLTGGWRPGYTGSQWDSTSSRPPADLAAMAEMVRLGQPAAAKDVSMAGVVGTLAMLAEASGCGAELDVTAVPRPAAADLADWLSCFPGYAMLTAAPAGWQPVAPLPDGVVSVPCGRLVPGAGVTLVWPDGHRTPAVSGEATGLGRAGPRP